MHGSAPRSRYSTSAASRWPCTSATTFASRSFVHTAALVTQPPDVSTPNASSLSRSAGVASFRCSGLMSGRRLEREGKVLVRLDGAGDATLSAPEVSKLRSLSEALRGGRLPEAEGEPASADDAADASGDESWRGNWRRVADLQPGRAPHLCRRCGQMVLAAEVAAWTRTDMAG
jgi:hypothetical protein